MNKIIISLLLVSVLLFGCIDLGGDQPEEEPEEEPEVEKPVPDPTFSIVGPADGDVIYTEREFSEVTVSLTVQNLMLKSPTGAAKKGEGHFHITVDNGDPIVVTTKTYTLTGLEQGEHDVKVELMNNDHSSYYPRVIREVSFTIERENVEYEPKEYTVTINDFDYEPSDITVNVGDKVTWVNNGAYPRSATCTDGFDTKVIAPGESATLVMDKALDCDYFALTHRVMKAHITVNEVE